MLAFMGNLFPKPKSNWLEIARKCYTKFGQKEGPTVPGIHKFIAKVCKTAFIVNEARRGRVRVPHKDLNISL